MKTLLLIITLATPALGQTVTVSASHLGGARPVTGVVTFQPALADGTPASARISSGGITTRQPLTATVTAGAFTLPNVPDTALSTPANLCYSVSVRSQNGLQVLGPGFSCVQPAANNSWCTSGVCNFDSFTPNLAALALTVPGAPGPTGPTGPVGPQGPAGSVAGAGTPGVVQVSNGLGGLQVSDAKTVIDALPIQEFRNAVNPPLSHWYQALANCQNQVVNVALIGDSTTVVYQSDGSSTGPTTPTNRWAEQLRIYLQNRCGSHGTGIVPFYKFLFPGSPNPNGQYYGPTTGSFTQDSTLGPVMTAPTSGTTYGTLARGTSGTSFNWTSALVGLPEDHVNVYCATGPGLTTITITVKPHGGTTTLATGTCGGSGSSNAAAIGTAGPFTSQIVDVAAACSGACLFYGMEGVNGTTGVSVHNMGHASGAAELYSSSSSFGPMDLVPGGFQLVITNFLTNEPGLGFTTSSFQTALTSVVNHERGTAAAPGILLYIAPVSNNGYPAQLPIYAAAALSTAQTLGTAFVNVQDQWGTAFVASLFDSDQVHSNDKGALSEWSLIKSSIVDVEPTAIGCPTCATLAASNTFTGDTQIVSAHNALWSAVADSTSSYAGVDVNETAKTGGHDWVMLSEVVTSHPGALVWIDNTTGRGVLAVDAFPSYSTVMVGSAGGYCWNTAADPTLAYSPDTCLWQTGAPGVLALGNGTQGDSSGGILLSKVSTGPSGSTTPLVIQANYSGSGTAPVNLQPNGGITNVGGPLDIVYIVPTNTTQPTGSCGPPGTFIVTLDGHASSCSSGSVWVSRW